MKRWVVLLTIGLLFLGGSIAQAQDANACKTPGVNLQGTAGASITVGSTAVVVLENNPNRCAFILKNVHASNTMNCFPSSQGTPTSSVGWTLAAGEQIKMTGPSSGPAWRCIQNSGASTAQVFEESK